MLRIFPCPSCRSIFIDSNISRESKFIARFATRITVSRDYYSLTKTFPKGTSELYRGWYAAAPLSRQSIPVVGKLQRLRGIIYRRDVDGSRAVARLNARRGRGIPLVNVDPRQGCHDEPCTRIAKG